MFIDTETNETVTLEQLRAEYDAHKADGTTEAASFDDYVTNCMIAENGTLKTIN